MMVFPADWDNENEETRDAVRDEWEEWFEVVEDEQTAEGDISVSETVDGKEPIPEIDDAERYEEFMQTISEDELDDLP